jgi:hypothetical protein
MAELSSFRIRYLSWLLSISDGEGKFLCKALMDADATSYATGNLHGKRAGIQFGVLRNVYTIPFGISEGPFHVIMIIRLITFQTVNISVHDL